MRKILICFVLFCLPSWVVADPFSGFGGSIYYSKSSMDVEGFRRFTNPAYGTNGQLMGSADGGNPGFRLGYMWHNESPDWSYVLSLKNENIDSTASVQPDLRVTAGSYTAVEAQFGKVRNNGFLYLLVEYGKLDLKAEEISGTFNIPDRELGVFGLGLGYAHRVGKNTSIHVEWVTRIVEDFEVEYIASSVSVATDRFDIDLSSLNIGLTYRF
ncbi:outer membrane protein [Marinospirillum alkaliphilum]|uniref:Outer membrane protein beta-barrel domain-containing protein n=1 Tax=Marinospirillum alkaliphilum DSM 21637 TaxID=1122209 RepID=A0A1K1W2L3_9GAMM|nr:outer membrane beta-barrel protein [Marinospirillum alkaliphilum]SFX31423.1 Outer membrane protein beta-barrel domain-containing protein [Marinospirillum alkaliphilum DSM 21637]